MLQQYVKICWQLSRKCALQSCKLSELCTPVAQVSERQHLRLASYRLLVMPRIQLDTYGRRAFAVVGPTVWNALDNNLRDPDLSIASFGRQLKTHLFQQYSVHRAH